MVVERSSGSISHHGVCDLPGYLQAGDLLVTNNTRVIPARLFGAWQDTGGKLEVLLVEKITDHTWQLMCRSARRVREGQVMLLCDGQIEGTVTQVNQGGRTHVRFSSERPFMEIVEACGVPPVPPYIQRDGQSDPQVELDRERYQTVFAREPGAVAAPTAGLHFSDSLLAEIEARDVTRTEITLHVGPGTFRPVKSKTVEGHNMESERYEIGDDAATKLERTRAGNGRIAAVGTTSVRTLETVMREAGKCVTCEGASDLFIYPPYRFLAVDVLVTNFHLPRSSLLMLVSAFAAHGMEQGTAEEGRELILRAYEEAVKKEYRFYSYGDCMLIL